MAIVLLEETADKNSWCAYLLGKLYLFGNDVVEKDKEKAVKLLTRSAGDGNEYAEALMQHAEDYERYVMTSTIMSLKAYTDKYAASLAGFDKYLYTSLVENISTLNISKQEAAISDEMFKRLEGLELVDLYDAYQSLDNEWTSIAVDLEILQTEGFDAVRIVDPNMVIKKKNGKEVEVQEGWLGHIIPFDLIQRVYFTDELEQITSQETRLAEITSEYEELLDSLSEEDNEADFVNDDKTAFVAAEVKKVIKAKDAEPEVLAVLKKYDVLSTEEKSLKKKIKTAQQELHLKTKAAIESLTDEQAKELLRMKWVEPIMASLTSIPNRIVAELTAKLVALSKKYEITFSEIEDDIEKTSDELCSMIDDLTGSNFDMQGLNELKALLGGCAE